MMGQIRTVAILKGTRVEEGVSKSVAVDIAEGSRVLGFAIGYGKCMSKLQAPHNDLTYTNSARTVHPSKKIPTKSLQIFIQLNLTQGGFHRENNTGQTQS